MTTAIVEYRAHNNDTKWEHLVDGYPKTKVRQEARSVGPSAGAPPLSTLQLWLRSLRLAFQASIAMSKAEVLAACGTMPCPIQAFACSPVNMSVALAKPNHVLEATVTNTAPLLLKAEAQRDVLCLRWSPTLPRTLAAACMEGVFLWQARQSPTFQHLPAPPTTALAFSPNGLYLATASPAEAAIRIYDLKDCSYRLLHRGRARLLLWSPTRPRLFFAGYEGYMGFVDMESGAVTLMHAPAPLSAACWSADGALLIIASSTSNNIYTVEAEGAHGVQVLFDLGELSREGVATGVSALALSADDTSLAVVHQGMHEPELRVFRASRSGPASLRLDDVLRLQSPGVGLVPHAVSFHPPQRADVCSVLGVVWATESIAELVFVPLLSRALAPRLPLV